MGPTIILDKSAFQSLSKEDTYELSRYFYTVIPPVLILEILADLKKPKLLVERKARAAVRTLARKVQPVEGIVNVDYRTLCVADLLGGGIKGDHRPIVAGARRVVAADGSVGAFIDVQPENQALIRWSGGYFDEAEQILASRWRAAAQEIDLDGAREELRGHCEWIPLNSLPLVWQVVGEVMRTPEAQPKLLKHLLHDLHTIPEVSEWTLGRWHNGRFELLDEFAAYASHCARVCFFFQMALVHELIGTRSTNWIDMQYLYYTPFAHIFCSGDKLHRAMANTILAEGQSFVWHEDLRLALRKVGQARKRLKDSVSDDWHALLPEEGSLIHSLWIKHLGHPPEAPRPRHSTSPEEDKTLMDKLRPIIEACKKAQDSSRPRPKWPCP